MKKKLLSLAIAGASLVAANSYAAGPTVYGKLNVSLQAIDTEGLGLSEAGAETTTLEDTWKLLSNASRLGVTGDAKLTSSTNAIYKLEYEVSVDGDDDEFRQRNIYVGLQDSGWGTLLAGKHDSPLKLSQGKADQFNDMYLADIKYIMVGENRPENTIMYSTPAMSGFSLTVAAMPGEETESDNADPNAPEADDGIADHFSVGLEFKMDALRLALAIDDDIKNNDVMRFTGEYAQDAFQVGLIYQTAEASDDEEDFELNVETIDGIDVIDYLVVDTLGLDVEETALLLSGAFKVNDKLKIKGQYGTGELDSSDFEYTVTRDLLALGLDYMVADSTTLFGYYANVSWEDDEEGFDTYDGDNTTFGVGIDHKF